MNRIAQRGWLRLAVLGLGAACLAAVCSSARADEPAPLAGEPTDHAGEGAVRPLVPFALETPSGARFDVGPHVGKDVMLISFWATWCKPCKTELATLAPLYDRLKDQGFVLVAVSVDGPDTVAEVAGFQKKNGYAFPIVLDTQTEVIARYNPRGDVPFSLVVDRTGAIVETHQGFNPGDEVALEARLRGMLEANSAGAAGPKAFIEGTDTFRVQYLHDNDNGRDTDDRVTALQNKLTLGAALDPLHLGVRVDNTLYPGYDRLARCAGDTLAKCPWEDDHRIERVSVSYETPALDVRAGDFYQSLGRGIVLSVRKVDELGLDTAIRGGAVRGEVGGVTIRALGGIANIQNVDTAIQGYLPERADRIGAGEVTVPIREGLTVAVRGSYLDYDEPAESNRDEADWTAGASVEWKGIADMLTLYAEGAAMQNLAERTSLVTGKVTDESTLGSAFYASAALTPAKGLSILFEYKDYRRFDLQNTDSVVPLVYVEPPTLERYDQIVPATANASGGRALVQYLIPDVELLATLNVLYYEWAKLDAFSHKESVSLLDDDKAEGALHIYTGLEKRWASGLSVGASGGWRLEAKNRTFSDAFASDFADGAPAFSRRLWHVEAEIHVPLGGPHALAFAMQHRSEEKALPPKIKSFVRGDASVTYSFAPALTLALLYTYETESAQDTGGQYLNFAGELIWRFSDWGQIDLFGGRNTGGIICASGVCRTLPPFFGGRAEFVARF